jgi:predicted nucleotide-binding protein
VEGVEDQAGVAGADLVGGETADHFVDDVLEVRLGGREREGKGLTAAVAVGRDHRLRRDLFSFLRAVGLYPLEFDEMAHLTGSTSASTWQVIQAGFERTQACVVLFSPDEHVRLRQDLMGGDDPEEGEMQPRPNVLVEAGMALALHPKRTIIVKVGDVRDVSDLDGMQYVRLTQSADSRNRLLGKLRLAGCDVKTHGSDWLNMGNFAPDAIGR